MKIKEIMTSPVQTCEPGTNLAAAASMMWDSDCGALPVVDHDGKVVGMITDRDICMAVVTKRRLASDITVWETITGKVYSCTADDDAKDALLLMKRERVRRLPVVAQNGILQGVVAMNDFVLRAEEPKGTRAPDLSYRDVMEALKSISGHRILVGI
ncbi:MAG: CBS domain-containing protein [Nitrospirae bacterium]|nr:CBS domain-containing protein [Nitrospirota bacterium]